jgi:hypothetical protein
MGGFVAGWNGSSAAAPLPLSPDQDRDRLLTVWLMADFRDHLAAARPSAALDYLREAFEQLLELPAYVARAPQGIAEEPMAARARAVDGNDPRSLVVDGRRVPRAVIDTMLEAARQLLTSAGSTTHAPAAPAQPGPGQPPAPRDNNSSVGGSVPAAPARGSPAAAPDHPDGPEAPHWFWWENVRHDWRTSRRPWMLLNYMWGRDTAPADAVLEALWADRRSLTTLRTNACRVNALLPRGYPRRLAVRQVEPGRDTFCVSWEDAGR